jgi:FtsZ-binding cell division protein ZapB
MRVKSMIARYNSAILQAHPIAMSDGPNFSEIGEHAATVVASVGALWLLIRKTVSQSLKADLDDAKARAGADIVEGLRAELQRLSNQNATLAQSLNELQVEIIELRAENGRLRVTIEGLNVEIETLRRSNEQSGFDRLGA